MQGRLHSILPRSTAHGPGARFTVRVQGCPLRCVHCPAPDCRAPSGGRTAEADELVRLARESGAQGVTLSGGEPLQQPAFAEAFLSLARQAGLHTVLHTAGAGKPAEAEQVLRHTDLVLFDLQALTAEESRACGGAEPAQAERFLRLAAMKHVPLWVRHIVIPGLTDGVEHLRLVRDRAGRLPNLEKLLFVPYEPCPAVYDRLGLPFALRGTPAMNEAWLKQLLARL